MGAEVLNWTLVILFGIGAKQNIWASISSNFAKPRTVMCNLKDDTQKWKIIFQQIRTNTQNIARNIRVTFWISELYFTEQKNSWDCGTGNGQVACELAKIFENVFATDISQAQIDNAIKAKIYVILFNQLKQQISTTENLT